MSGSGAQCASCVLLVLAVWGWCSGAAGPKGDGAQPHMDGVWCSLEDQGGAGGGAGEQRRSAGAAAFHVHSIQVTLSEGASHAAPLLQPEHPCTPLHAPCVR